MRIRKQTTTLLIALSLSVLASQIPKSVLAQPPAHGKPIPELDVFDWIMQSYMDDHDINGAVLAIMKDHTIVYQRSFGWKDEDLLEFLPENALMRVASVTKPFTAASIRYLINRGMIRADQCVFDFDPQEDGILDYEPFDGLLGDSGFWVMTVEDLLKHEGGWDRSVTPDPTYNEVEIAQDYGFDPYRVPTRRETVEWILSQPLDFWPGTDSEYANPGFLILGLIVEQVSGTDLHTFWREHILPEEMWFPTSEFELGRSLEEDKNPREPWYHWLGLAENVYDPDGPPVRKSYGGFDLEARDGQGRMITSAVPLLHLTDTYYCKGDSIGVRLNGRTTSPGHDGRLWGTEAMACQRDDGISFVILLPKSEPDHNYMYVREIRDEINNMIDNGGFTWPNQAVDGVWFDFDHLSDEQGCYDEPYNSIWDLGNVMAWSKVRFKSGSTPWTGVVTRAHLELSAPEGPVVIGESRARRVAGASTPTTGF